ncbi:MAG: phenylacetate--CoA ligase, partial [Oscillospiraceae bacterium]|nr:phenylacetate--CoA ligase [Oscillospiraceae bacterium]
MNMYDRYIETLDREELKKLQSERLVKKLQQVYANVKPYREKMSIKPEDIKSVDDLYKLPFTTKQDLRDNYPYGMFAVPMSEVVRIHATSGTTGKQTVVGYTKNDLE